jgi:hypothetical protein
MKIDVAESNGDVVSGLRHPLVAETTFVQVSKYITARKSQTVGDRCAL